MICPKVFWPRQVVFLKLENSSFHQSFSFCYNLTPLDGIKATQKILIYPHTIFKGPHNKVGKNNIFQSKNLLKLENLFLLQLLLKLESSHQCVRLMFLLVVVFFYWMHQTSNVYCPQLCLYKEPSSSNMKLRNPSIVYSSTSDQLQIIV